MNTTNKPLPHIALCIILDIIGYASFSLPILGEVSDLIWAPLSGFIFYRLFGGKMGMLGGGLSFIEELLPFTDFIPTFTIAWVMRYFSKKEVTAVEVIETRVKN
ncbi:MAG TPA: hypothetical protein VLR49_04900 [Ferruginibacter sp.]|nr:hypothetical protein [Ferruginibacter sp.]